MDEKKGYEDLLDWLIKREEESLHNKVDKWALEVEARKLNYKKRLEGG